MAQVLFNKPPGVQYRNHLSLLVEFLNIHFFNQKDVSINFPVKKRGFRSQIISKKFKGTVHLFG